MTEPTQKPTLDFTDALNTIKIPCAPTAGQTFSLDTMRADPAGTAGLSAYVIGALTVALEVMERGGHKIPAGLKELVNKLFEFHVEKSPEVAGAHAAHIIAKEHHHAVTKMFGESHTH